MMNNEIKAHYASPGLYERIVQGLEPIGKSPASVDLDDLAALDEFHLRGPAATQELIEILDVGADSHVLDVGSGLGGPARRLAKATGCRVTGVDLSVDYCAVGNELSGWLGLSERVRLEPWAATPEQSFLATADEMSAHLERAGFSIMEIKDETSQALAFLDENAARTEGGGPPPLGLHLVLGPTFKEIIAVTRRNLAEGRLAPTLIYTRKN